ncbi:MAG: PIN domain-containing protein [Chloroflexota bacterium]
MKIYLDNCALQRPLDDKSQIRIRLEAEAILSLIAMLKADKFELISSEMLDYELEKTPIKARRDYGNAVLEMKSIRIDLNEEIENRAKSFIGLGIKPLDSLHLASSEAANSDYFCTCDDRFLRRAKSISNLRVKVVTPL